MYSLARENWINTDRFKETETMVKEDTTIGELALKAATSGPDSELLRQLEVVEKWGMEGSRRGSAGADLPRPSTHPVTMTWKER